MIKQGNAYDLSDEAINKFIEIYQKRFNVTLTRDEAIEKGSQLLQMFRLVYAPNDKNQTTD